MSTVTPLASKRRAEVAAAIAAADAVAAVSTAAAVAAETDKPPTFDETLREFDVYAEEFKHQPGVVELLLTAKKAFIEGDATSTPLSVVLYVANVLDVLLEERVYAPGEADVEFMSTTKATKTKTTTKDAA